MDFEELSTLTYSTTTLPYEIQAVTLLQLLSNPLILHHTVPYLPIYSTLALGAISRSFRELIHHTPHVFRYLDLRCVKYTPLSRGKVTWDQFLEIRRERFEMQEEGTEGFYLYCNTIQERIGQNPWGCDILKDVQTLVLDGHCVSADIVCEIMTSLNVRLLSIREVRGLDNRSLAKVLQHMVRPSRPQNTPRLKGLYIFGSSDPSTSEQTRSESSDFGEAKRAIAATIGESWNQKSSDHLLQSLNGTGEKWYCKSGRMIKEPLEEWGSLLLECKDIISFDAPLCAGPRHSLPTQAKDGIRKPRPWYSNQEFHIPPRVATFALGGCHSCGKCPEGLAKYGQYPAERFPLLAPVPIHQSTIKAAKIPEVSPTSPIEPHIVARCQDCLRNRYCECCNKWWCEDCYDDDAFSKGHGVSSKSPSESSARNAQSDSNDVKGVTRECWDCGLNCFDCSLLRQQRCIICGGGYCTIHNEGSTLTTCDWCSTGNNRHHELY